MQLKGQRVLLTGASSGIGEAMAKILAESDIDTLVLVARREERLNTLRETLMAKGCQAEVLVMPCDLSQTEAIDDLVNRITREIGAVDILINNAGLGDFSLFENSDWRKIELMLQVNIQGLTYLTHKLVAPMIALGRGGILNVSSGFGFFFMPGMAAYAASKHYVTAFSEALRIELKGTGVNLTQVCPGPVQSEFAQVAGNRALGDNTPEWLMLRAETCAREALEGFVAERPLVVPGLAMRLIMGAGRLVPRPLVRLALSRSRGRLIKMSGLQNV